ncbi:MULTISPECIES: non-ribosomal peptide synthetase [Flavobacterium]|uniref:Non-ribosomal peptide synthetase n=1 Tax=Flavobacterium jumunjinense TaxID=998845 RepID=A0ABV5GV58_9FLAO|nr:MULTISPECIES: non-ribosomal peptide synthetase [Flavobacterium]
MITLKQIISEYKEGKISTSTLKEKLIKYKKIEEGKEYPLSTSQKGLWLLHKQSLLVAKYNVPLVLRFDKAVTETALKNACKLLVKVHPLLGASFSLDLPQYKIPANPYIDFQYLDQQGKTEKEIIKLMQEITDYPLDITKAPVRFRYIHNENSKTYFLMTIHHLVCDGTSLVVLFQTLMNILSSNDDFEKPLLVPYNEFVGWEKNYLNSVEAKQHQKYWKEKLQNLPDVISLHKDFYKNPDQIKYKGGILQRELPDQISQKIKIFCTKNQLSIASFLLGGYQLLLRKYTAQNDIIIGVPSLGRSEEEYNNIVGYFINMIPVRLLIQSNSDIKEHLKELQYTVMEGIDNAMYPFPLMVKDQEGTIGQSELPIFQFTFAYQNFIRGGSANSLTKQYKDDFDVSILKEVHQYSNYELAFELGETDNSFDITAKYNSINFSPETIDQIVNHYIKILAEIVNDEVKMIADISLVSEKEREIIEGANNTKVSYNSQKCIQQYIGSKAINSPNEITLLEQQGKQKTNYQIQQEVNKIASCLIQNGVLSGDSVGIYMNRSANLITTVLGVLAAGGVFVPLSPDFPEERINFIIKDANIKVLIFDSDTKSKTEVFSSNVQLVINSSKIQQDQELYTLPFCSEKDRAYIIYTSGSTGNPKGVPVTHQSILNTLHYLEENFPLRKNDNYILKTNYVFDVSLSEIFGWLIGEGTLIIPNKGVEKSPAQLLDFIHKFKITHINFVPSLLKVFVNHVKKKDGILLCNSLKYILVAGEAFPVDLVKESIGLFKDHCQVINVYGPTEASIYASSFNCSIESVKTLNTPIGLPISNTELYVLDIDNKEAGLGIPGELCLAGTGVVSSYLNREELSASKFCKNTFSKKYNDFYKTGDWVKRLSNGQIEYLGRIDEQVKIRGYRIELGEIEVIIREVSTVEDVVCLVKEVHGVKQIWAYVQSLNTNLPTVLYKFLSDKLPLYMIPSQFVIVSAIPITVNGKIDRKKLIDIRPNINQTINSKEDKQDHLIQNELIQIWEEILEVSGIGIEDRFLEIGGDSILATVLIDKVNLKFETEFDASDLFQYSTISLLSEKIHKTGLLNNLPSKKEHKKTSEANEDSSLYEDSLAIIGMSCTFPEVQNIRDFWNLLIDEKETFRFLETEELKKMEVSESVIKNLNFVPFQSSIASKEYFDAPFFKISKRDAGFMDPQLRMLLEHAWHTIEDSGYKTEDIKDTAVYISSGNNFYRSTLPEFSDEQTGVLEHSDQYVSWIYGQGGTIPTMISYKLGLEGPSLYLHSNCSSSLSGLYTAYQSIMRGECKQALVGAANVGVVNSPGYIHQNGLNFSSDGHLKAFDADADGMVGGEGVTMILVKKASEAIKDKDPIYCLLKGIALNNDGNDKAGFYAPSFNGQKKVIQKVLDETGINPESISYVEAHGTGTKLGDPIEFNALSEVYKNYTNKTNYCAIGSVKTNLGHVDTAAGLAGVIKIALSMSNQQLPATLNFKNPNPQLKIENSPFYISNETKSWMRNGTPLRAAISSFGIGGTNGHAIFEQANIETISSENEQKAYPNQLILPVSALNKESLRVYVQHLKTFICQNQLVENQNADKKNDKIAKQIKQYLAPLLNVEEQEIDLLQLFEDYISDLYYLESLSVWIFDVYGLKIGSKELYSLNTLEKVIEKIGDKIKPTAVISITKEKLASLAYTFQKGRNEMSCRVAFVFKEVEELLKQFNDFLKEENLLGVYSDKVVGLIGKENHEIFSLEEKTALEWVNGESVNWENCWKSTDRVIRISAPGYPFAKVKFELPSFKEKKKIVRDQMVTHPLLHENNSGFDNISFSSNFSGEEHFLSDHVINGQKILPGVAHLEMALQAYFKATTLPVQPCLLTNIFWVKPIVQKSEKQKITISLSKENEGNCEFFINTISEDNNIQNSKGYIKKIEDSLQSIPPVNIEGFKEKGTDVIEGTKIYDAFLKNGVTYGTSHQVIQKLWIKGTEALVLLNVKKEYSNSLYQLHPSIMDGAFQAVIGFKLQSNDQSIALPFGIRNLKVFKKTKDVTWAYIKEFSANNGNIYDICLLNQQGEVCVDIKGYQTRIIGKGIKNKNEQEILVDKIKQNNDYCLIPTWELASSISGQEFLPDICLIFGENTILENSLKNRGFRVFLVKKTLNLNDFREIIGTERIQNISCIIPYTNNIESETDNSHFLVDNTYYLIKAFLKEGYAGKKLRWSVFTERAFMTTKEDKINAIPSALHGLFGVIQKEYQNWDINLCDMEFLDENLKNIKELPLNKQGITWAYRNNSWYKQKLSKASQDFIKNNDTTILNDNKVLVIIGGAGNIGRKYSKYLYDTYQAKIVWIGRQITEKVSFEGLDFTPFYVQADITKYQELECAITTIQSEIGSVYAIIHSTMALADSSFEKMTESQFHTALDNKVIGLINIGKIIKEILPEWLLCFSSIASYVRVPGQANYTAGCVFTDQYALQIEQQYGVKTKIINWGYWGHSEEYDSNKVREKIEKNGVAILAPAMALQFLDGFMKVDHKQVAYIKMSEDLINSKLGKELMESPSHIEVFERKSKSSNEQKMKLQKNVLEPELLMIQTKNYLLESIATVLRMEKEEIDTSEALEAYGLDSILVVQIANELGTIFPNINTTIFFEYQTIEEITTYLITNYEEEVSELFSQNNNDITIEKETEGIEIKAESIPVINDDRIIEEENKTVLLNKVVDWLKEQISDIGGIAFLEIDINDPLDSFSLDSVQVVSLIENLNKIVDEVSTTIFFESENLKELAESLLVNRKDQLKSFFGNSTSQEVLRIEKKEIQKIIPTNQKSEINALKIEKSNVLETDVAIIGVTGKYPLANDLETFWSNLKEGRDCITEVPLDRWDADLYYDKDKNNHKKSYGKWGGFLSDIDQFDPLFFNISPSEAEIMDPKERIFLETIWELFEKNGITQQKLKQQYNSMVGVYVGSMYQHYHCFSSDVLREAVVSMSCHSSIANRVSYFFNLQGPSIAINTMCSSSLIAIDMAYKALLLGDCELAIAGGVNLSLHPKKYIGLSATRTMGSHVDSRSFSEGDGYLPAEGVGAVLLKPLSKAIADGDTILGVIKSSSSNHGGRSNGFAVPNPKAQVKLIETNFKKSGIDPRTISYVESAVNGSNLGDPIEIAALNKAFEIFTPDKQFCAIGTVKSNIGHAEAASGISQLTKVLLQLKHKTLVPTIKTEPLNKQIRLEETPFVLQKELKKWNRPIVSSVNDKGEIIEKEYPRRATISSFGAGGSNAHLIIEEFNTNIDAENDFEKNESLHEEKLPNIFVLSSRSNIELRRWLEMHYEFMSEYPEILVTDIAFTLKTGRELMDYRIAITFDSKEHLKETISKVLKESNWNDMKEFSNVFLTNKKATNNIVNRLFKDDTGNEILNLLLEKGDLNKIAVFWASGSFIPWLSIYDKDKLPNIVSLPSYPFQKKRCWIKSEEDLAVNNVKEEHSKLLSQNAEKNIVIPNSDVSLSSSEKKIVVTGHVKDLLKEVWQEVLGVENIEWDDNFQALGGDSIMLTHIISRIKKEVPFDVNVTELYQRSTLEEMAVFLEEIFEKHELETELLSFSTVRNQGQIIPVLDNKIKPSLSFAQQRLWFLDQMVKNSPAYNVVMALHTEGNIDKELLQKSFENIIYRHETLRTSFKSEKGEPYQHVATSVPNEIIWKDLTSIPKSEREQAFEEYTKEEARHIFNLEQGDLLRLTIFKIEKDEHVLVLNAHHIIIDGWSVNIFFSELFKNYSQYIKGEIPSLEKLPIQYTDFSIWQRMWLQGEELETQLSYWRGKLGSINTMIELPLDNPRPPVQTFQGGSTQLELPVELLNKLRATAKAYQVTLFELLLGAFKIILHRFSGQKEIIIGTPVNNRNRLEIEGLIGFFVNTLVIKTNLEGNPSFKEFLKRLQNELNGAKMHQDLPFEQLVQELQPDRNMSQNPLFQVCFNMLITPEINNTNIHFKKIHGVRNDTSKFDLWVNVIDQKEKMTLEVEYNSVILFKDTVIRFMNSYQNLLEEIVKDGDKNIGELLILDNKEQKKIIKKSSGDKVDYQKDICLHQIIEAQGLKTPNAIAVSFENKQLDYQELSQLTNQLSHYLIAEGVQLESFVGVCLERSLEMIVSLLSVLKAGGAYVPIDPNYPKDRLNYILDDSNPQVVISHSKFKELFVGTTKKIIYLDEINDILNKQDRLNSPSINISEQNLAYMIYTSGSTGKPKGAMIEHRSIVNRLFWMQDEYRIDSTDKILQKTPYSFDVSVWEFFLPLMQGAQLVFAKPEGHKDPGYLIDLIESEKITILHFVPSMLQVFLEVKTKLQCKSIKKVFCSGEALPFELVQRFFKSFDSAELHNLYGPTEAAVDVTYWHCKREDSSGIIPIGFPVANTQIYVLDNYGNIVPDGVIGEIHIGGIQVARGYHNKESLTNEKFVKDPFSEHGKLYKTGDLGRRLKDGSVEYKGRIDFQVKIRGMRIELGEIEAALGKISFVKESVILAQNISDNEQDKQLIGYVVPDVSMVKKILPDNNKSESIVQTKEWEQVFNNTYEVGNTVQGKEDFNIIGWNSSYSGEEIAESEMKVWVDTTVHRILELKPQKVLEIGCGTGLLVSKIASHVKDYTGTDISKTGLDYIEKYIQPNLPKSNKLKLFKQEANDFHNLDQQSYDMIIINSVAQYFGNYMYFIEVIKKAVSLLDDEGKLFIGDIRNKKLHRTFLLDVELYKSSQDQNAEAILKTVKRKEFKEPELVIDPNFFRVIQKEIPEISHVTMDFKRGDFLNELTKYRYDVLLHVNKKSKKPEKTITIDFLTDLNALEYFEKLVNKNETDQIKLQNVPNKRLYDIGQLEQCIKDNSLETKKSELKQLVAKMAEYQAVDPEYFYSKEQDTGYKINVSPSADNSFYMDVVFLKKELWNQGYLYDGNTNVTELLPIERYLNNPSLQTIQKEVSDEIKKVLLDQLPDYMIPKHIVLLDAMPVNFNGKLDRKEFPDIQDLITTEATYIAPVNKIQEKLVELWKRILKIDSIGIEDSFFNLGGHSLNVISMLVKANEEIGGQKISLVDFYKSPTIKGLEELLKVENSKPTGIIRELVTTKKTQLSILFVPYAGGTATAFHPVAQEINRRDSSVSSWAVSLPGNEYGEEKKELSIKELSKKVVEEITQKIKGPIGIYGHCVGSYLAIEIARRLENRGLKIEFVMLGGLLPIPKWYRMLPSKDPWKHKTDEQLVKMLHDWGMRNEEIEPYLLQFMVRNFRVDAMQSYLYTKENKNWKLETPIINVVGTKDPITKQYNRKFKRWKEYGNSVHLAKIETDNHYFISDMVEDVAEIIHKVRCNSEKWKDKDLTVFK